MQQFKNEGLDKYAETDADRDVFKALVDCGGEYETMAAQLGIAVSSVRNRLHRLRKRAAMRGWSPNQDVQRPTPDGFHVKGVSSLYSRDAESGKMELSAQWVKTNKDSEDRLEAMRIACEELAAPLKGVSGRTRMKAAKGSHDSELMATYLIGDHHTGMYSWAAETGADWDCDIAETMLWKAFLRLGQSTPNAYRGLIVGIGDFFHADNSKGVTPHSGHSLDTDSRHARVIQIGIRMWKRAIRFALEKHEVVDVDVIPGNHDPESALWLAHCLASAFEDEPRVTVNTTPRAHHYVTHGGCLIGLTHGDRSKPADLGSIMAVDCREGWGEARFCHWYIGHIHHKTVQEFRGCTVESLRVLAPGDSWHVGQGYRSQRGMQVDVWHKEQGRILTVHGTVEYIEAPC
jgi:hypothetical protein